MCAMSRGELELEPEVRELDLSLGEDDQARVRFHIERLADQGPLLDEPHTRQLDGKLRELRFYLGGRATRVTYWIGPGRRVILLTVFSKTGGKSGLKSAGRSEPWSGAWRNNTPRVRSDRMSKRAGWEELKASEPLSEAGRAAYDDEARISAFRELVFRLRTEAKLTQAELAQRMGTTQSAIARMEGGGTRPTLDTLEKLAAAVGRELVVLFGEVLLDDAGGGCPSERSVGSVVIVEVDESDIRLGASGF